MKSIKLLIYEQLREIIPISEITFLPNDKTIQVHSQGMIIGRKTVHDRINKSQVEAQRIIASWSAEIYGF